MRRSRVLGLRQHTAAEATAQKEISNSSLSIFTAQLFDHLLDIFPNQFLSAGLRSK